MQQRLHDLGIRFLSGGEAESQAAFVRIARVLHWRGCHRVGLIPAGDEVAVPPVALHVAIALSQLTGRPAGVIDAQGSWLPPDEPGPVAAPGSALVAAWLNDTLALFAPPPAGAASTLPALRAFLHGPGRELAHLVVDLTGLDHSGEHAEALALLDGAAVVARAGSTTTPQLERRMRDIPEAQRLGVILVGVEG